MDALENDVEVEVPLINGDKSKMEEDEDGLKNESKKEANGDVSPLKKKKDDSSGDNNDNNEENEDKNNQEKSGGGSLNASPCHSWISNASSCTNLFEDDDEEYEGDGGKTFSLFILLCSWVWEF